MSKRDYRVADSLLGTTGLAALTITPRYNKKAMAGALDIVTSGTRQADSHAGCVLANWLTALPRHDQRIVISCFRGMDQGAGGADAGKYTKILVHAMRQACQKTSDDDFAEDGHYLGDPKLLPHLDKFINIKKVRREIEHVSNHYLDHLLNPLYIIGRECGEPWRGYYQYLWKKLSFPQPDWSGAINDQLASAV